MRGHIEQLPSSAWRVSVPLGKDPTTGKNLRSMQIVQGTKKDAEGVMTRLPQEIDTGSHVEPSCTTVGAVLDRWIKDYVGFNIQKFN